MFKKLDHCLDRFETGSFILLLAVMTFVVFVQVLFRYVIHASLPWSEELSRYCMVYTVFIGVGAGLKAGTHTGVDAVVSFLPPKAKNVVVLIEKLVCFILSVIFFVLSLQVVIQLFASGQKSASLFIPIAFAYLAMPLGFAGGIIRSIQNISAQVKVMKGAEC